MYTHFRVISIGCNNSCSYDIGFAYMAQLSEDKVLGNICDQDSLDITCLALRLSQAEFLSRLADPYDLSTISISNQMKFLAFRDPPAMSVGGFSKSWCKKGNIAA